MLPPAVAGSKNIIVRDPGACATGFMLSPASQAGARIDLYVDDLNDVLQ